MTTSGNLIYPINVCSRLKFKCSHWYRSVPSHGCGDTAWTEGIMDTQECYSPVPALVLETKVIKSKIGIGNIPVSVLQETDKWREIKQKRGAGQMEKVPRKGLHVARPLPSATDRERSACSTRSDVNRQHHKSRVAKNLRIRPVKAAYETSTLSKHRPLSRLCQPIPGQGITSWATTVWST